jgi:hypothetical protein
MESPSNRGSLRFDEAGHLLDELPCIKCAYILRGLTLESTCPECGTAVGRSVKGDFLKFADPMWVSKLANGMNWIIGAIIASIVLGCVGSGISSSTGDTMISSVLELAAGIVTVIGFWLLTTPDPGAIEPSPINTRNLTRYSMLGAYVLTVIAVTLTFLAFSISLVVFRSGSLQSAGVVLSAMAGFDGVVLPASWMPASLAGTFSMVGITADPAVTVFGGFYSIMWVLAAAFIVFAMPNVHEIMQAYGPVLESYSGQVKPARIRFLRWSPAPIPAIVMALITVVTIMFLWQPSEFIYYQF